MMGFLPILSDSQPKKMKPGVASSSAIAVSMLVVAPSTFSSSFEEEQGVELARVPHHGLSHDRADQGDEHDLQIRPAAERLRERRLRGGAHGSSS